MTFPNDNPFYPLPFPITITDTVLTPQLYQPSFVPDYDASPQLLEQWGQYINEDVVDVTQPSPPPSDQTLGPSPTTSYPPSPPWNTPLPQHGPPVTVNGGNVCEFCLATFRKPSVLKNHIVMHTGAKPHPCTFDNCGKRFGTSSNAKRHLRNVHKENPDSNRYRRRRSH